VAAFAKIASASLDDVVKMSAKAAGKSAGIVIDDAAVTPRYVVSFAADRELPIIGKIAWGSALNKLFFLLPGALLLSTIAPWSILPLLILGGAYLCYEGYGKVRELFVADSSEKTAKPLQAIESEALEREKIASAIRTDFILSAEIMAITLSTVGEASLAMKAIVLAVVVAEYGLSGPEYWIKDVGASVGSMMPIGGRMVAWVVGAALAGMAGLAIGAAVAPLSKHVIRPLWQRLLKLRCFDFYRTRTQ
jgi:predicted DNA repair protein MutK